MKIAIFGGGHGVCAAARLSDADHEARLGPRWRPDAAAPPPPVRAGTFTTPPARGPGGPPAPAAPPPAVRAGTFTSAALKGAEPGAIAAPATAWHAIARAMAPRRRPG